MARLMLFFFYKLSPAQTWVPCVIAFERDLYFQGHLVANSQYTQFICVYMMQA